MKPSSRVPVEEEFSHKLDELKVKLEKRDEEIVKIKDELKMGEKKDENIDDVIQKMKDKDKSTLHTVRHEDEVSCPTCGNHVHKLTSNGLVAKCIGDKCGNEYIMVPKNADSRCTTCGIMWKKPDEKSKYEVKDCPMCGNMRAVKFNLEEMIKQDKSRRV